MTCQCFGHLLGDGLNRRPTCGLKLLTVLVRQVKTHEQLLTWPREVSRDAGYNLHSDLRGDDSPIGCQRPYKILFQTRQGECQDRLPLQRKFQ